MEAKPNHGQAKYSFTLNGLREIKLTDWPPPAIANHPLIKEGMAESKRLFSTVSNIRIWSPYPIRAYTSKGAEAYNGGWQVTFFLFPSTSPREQADAVGQAIFRIRDGVITTCWADMLDEHELSPSNSRDIVSAKNQVKEG